ncbi:MAG TPA: NAD(P)H-binding protein [Jatrophihabitans sp.]|nr:NAD(P)H-binding protein [Jatrophihabitans sp.]
MRIAVTGATGRLGGQVVDLLAATGVHEVVAVSRHESSTANNRRQVVAATADYADLDALRAAFDGVDTLVFVSSDGEAVNVLYHHGNIVRAAIDRGLTHIVALSGLDADTRSPFCYAVSYGLTEELLRESGCAVSIVRASIFTEFFMHFLEAARTTGDIRVPAADGRISLVARTDVGRCLAALASAAPAQRLYEVTGPVALDLAAIAAAASQHWKIPIAYVDVTPTEFLIEKARDGTEPWWCYAFSTMFHSIRQHRWARVTGEVAKLTGRRPLLLSDVLAESR